MIGFRSSSSPTIRELTSYTLAEMMSKNAAKFASDRTSTFRTNNAWGMANMYFGEHRGLTPRPRSPAAPSASLGNDLLRVLGILLDDHPFADYVVHETAHMFHNNKRRTIGLPATRRRQWLLSIEFAKRETFAYACEAYSRVLGRESAPLNAENYWSRSGSTRSRPRTKLTVMSISPFSARRSHAETAGKPSWRPVRPRGRDCPRHRRCTAQRRHRVRRSVALNMLAGRVMLPMRQPRGI